MALGVFAVSTAVAQVPTTFNFQGKLTDTKNNPITTTVDVTFEIFDVPIGGIPLHTEVMSITPDNGFFNVRIGNSATNPINTAIINGKRHFGIKLLLLALSNKELCLMQYLMH